MADGKTILVTALDWGLGHASRCIPIVKELKNQGARVVLASDGGALALLQDAFPDTDAIRLPSYGIRYSGRNMVVDMAWQLPRIIRTIRSEWLATQTIVRQYAVHGIISDHRYGCFHRNIPSVFLSHQLHPRIPVPGVEAFARYCHHQLIRRFDSCWIPDVPGPDPFTGELSRPLSSQPFRHLGTLSRMQPGAADQVFDLVMVLSGPEPQRTRLEKELLRCAARLPGRSLLVRGIPGPPPSNPPDVPDRVTVVPFLGATALNKAILSSGLYVGRAGYSTIMDLAVLRKKALLIPTPGQTEQEYLAERLHRKGFFLTQTQGSVDLAAALSNTDIPLEWPAAMNSSRLLHAAVHELLSRC
ncbi:MAG: hypothetical protein RLY31_2648 [Bacteroidota bacterium]